MTSSAILEPHMFDCAEEPAAEPDARSVSSGADMQAVRACLAGDPQAFDALVERHQRGIYRLCFRYVGNHHDASDLAQETFLKAFRSLVRFRGDSAFSTWLHRIAVNTCLNYCAARRPTEELSETLPAAGSDQARIAEQAQARRLVREAVRQLPEKQRRTLLLKVYDEMTHEEVARTLGSSVGTVKANLFHAVANLRKILTGDGRRG